MTSARALCESPRCRAHGQHTADCADETCRGCLPRVAVDGRRLVQPDTEETRTDE